VEKIITKSFARLMGRGTHRGFITYEELSKSLGKRNLSDENLSQAFIHILDENITLVEKKSDFKVLRKKENSNKEEGKTIEKSDDPIRMYLREMGGVELLSREGEIAIAKRIEAGKDVMLIALSQSPFTAQQFFDWNEKLQKIINNEIQILVGTQLISKGFHFPHLNCIVVVDIDLSSHGHDLRGAEKNLQLYHQLSGRAGRTGNPATVYFQTYENNSKMISEITNKNPDIYLERELEIRKKNKLPPYQRFISLILTGENEKKLEKEAFNFKNFIENKINGKILGPVNAPIFRIKKNLG